jgi:hypothetical protein
MTLQEILQVIGVAGVISSLIYAAIQVRRNTRTVRAATYQQLALSIVGVWDDFAKNADLCDLILRAGDDFGSLGRVERARFRFSMMGYLRRYETAYFQHKIGILRGEDWASVSADLEAVFSRPGVRAVWPLISNRSNRDFRSHIEGLLKRVPAEAA